MILFKTLPSIKKVHSKLFKCLANVSKITSTTYFKRNLSLCQIYYVRICVAGGAGSVGQPMNLLLKISQDVTELRVYDIINATGVAVDLSHINTPVKVRGFHGHHTIRDAMSGCEIIMIPAGVPRRPGMTADDLFNLNASIVRDITKVIAEVSPDAMIGIITSPVNSCTAICAKVMEMAGKLNPARIFGLTSLDVTRTRVFIGELKNLNPVDVKVPVVGGHAGDTIVPLISQVEPKIYLSQPILETLVKKIQTAGNMVVEAKAGLGSATLSTAYCSARFTNSIIRALKGEKEVVECCYVLSNITKAKFFASPVLIGTQGIEKIYGVPEGITKYEETMIEKAVGLLQESIEKGEKFAIGRPH